MSQPARRDTRTWLPLGLLTAAVVWFVLAPMLAADFGAIDDSEIASIMGPDRRVDAVELGPQLQAWLSIDTTSRFRPLRSVFRFAEIAAWGWNPAGWYLDRLLLAIATIVATALVAARFVARPIAVLAGLLVFVGLQAEAWYRLGPQEAYAVPLFMCGLAAIAYRRAGLGVALIILAALTKEAFVPMAALALAWTWQLGHRRSAIAGAAAVVLITAAAVITVMVNGAPFPQTRSLLTIGSELKWMLTQSAIVTAWPVFALLLVAVDRRLALFIAGLAAAILIPQAVLDADLRSSRYMLPASLAAIAISCAGLWWLSRRSMRVAVAATYAVALIALPSAAAQAAEASRWAAETRDFQSSLATIARELAAHPGAVLVVRPTQIGDYEPVFALRAYLPGGMAMLLPPPPLDRPNVSEHALYDTLVAVSERGAGGYVAWRQPASCVEATLHRPLTPALCATSVVVTGVR